LITKPEGKRPLGKPKHRWEDNIRTDLRVTGWELVDWIMSQDKGLVADPCKYSNEPFGSIKGREFLD